MSKQDQFDERVRQAVKSLDDTPISFRQTELWQQLQSELHAAPTNEASPARVLIRKYFVMPTRTGLPVRASITAAATVLLLIAAGLGWQWPRTEKVPLAQNKIKTTETATAKPSPKLRQSPPRRLIVARKTSDKTQKFADFQVIDNDAEPMTIAVEKPASQTDNPPLALAPTTATVLTETQPEKKTKPKFKVVHANELDSYQRTEVAATLEKEADNNGFIIINWRKKTEQPSENTLLTWLKNKSSNPIQ